MACRAETQVENEQPGKVAAIALMNRSNVRELFKAALKRARPVRQDTLLFLQCVLAEVAEAVIRRTCEQAVLKHTAKGRRVRLTAGMIQEQLARDGELSRFIRGVVVSHSDTTTKRLNRGGFAAVHGIPMTDGNPRKRQAAKKQAKRASKN